MVTRWTTMRISDVNKNWLELERLMRKGITLDEALTELRKEFLKGNNRKDYVFHL